MAQPRSLNAAAKRAVTGATRAGGARLSPALSGWYVGVGDRIAMLSHSGSGGILVPSGARTRPPLSKARPIKHLLLAYVRADSAAIHARSLNSAMTAHLPWRARYFFSALYRKELGAEEERRYCLGGAIETQRKADFQCYRTSKKRVYQWGQRELR